MSIVPQRHGLSNFPEESAVFYGSVEILPDRLHGLRDFAIIKKIALQYLKLGNR